MGRKENSETSLFGLICLKLFRILNREPSDRKINDKAKALYVACGLAVKAPLIKGGISIINSLGLNYENAQEQREIKYFTLHFASQLVQRLLNPPQEIDGSLIYVNPGFKKFLPSELIFHLEREADSLKKTDNIRWQPLRHATRAISFSAVQSLEFTNEIYNVLTKPEHHVFFRLTEDSQEAILQAGKTFQREMINSV